MSGARTSDFGAVLVAARRACHLTQEALAEQAGVGLRTVQALERGTARPRRETIRRLSETLGVPVESWLDYVHVRRSPPPAPGSNVPAPRTGLVGREDELADGLARLHAARLLTLTGPGGVGKTRLAVELATRAGADRVCWVELTGPQAATPLVTLALQLRVAVPPDGLLAAPLAAALEPHAAPLVVFDGCEHVLEAVAAAAGSLLDARPGLRIVCTSRAPLRVYGEATLAVEPLPVDSAAAALFFERARLVRAPLEETPETRRLVQEVCRRLDGLPLSVELAAAATADLPLEEVVERVAEGGALSLEGWRDSPARHRTLRDVLAWSHALLGPDEQVLFRRLAVFVGTFAEDAAVAVGDGVGALRRLVEASLVDAADPSGRLRLLDTVRDYAAELLRLAGEEPATRQRHLAFFAGQSARVTPLLQGAEQRRWLQRLDDDLPDILAAADWAAAPCEPGSATREERLALALPMLSLPWRYWFLSGSCGVGRDRLLELLALTGPPPWSDVVRRARASGLGGACVLAMHLGDADAALELGEESHALQGDDGHDGRADCVALALGMIRVARGEERLALPLLEEALGDGARRADDEVIAFSSLYLGRVLASIGRTAAATARTLTALDRFERTGDRWGKASALHALGVLERSASLDRSAELLEQSVALFREYGDRGWHAQALADLARTRHLQGDLTAADRLYEQSEQLAAEAGYRDRAAARLRLRALLACDRGDDAVALATWSSGLDEALAANQAAEVAAHLETAASWARDAHPADIVRLLGAAGSIRRGLGVVAPPDERAAILDAFARCGLGAAEAVAAWRAGRAERTEAAVDRARALHRMIALRVVDDGPARRGAV